MWVQLTWAHIWQVTFGARSHSNTIALVYIKVVAVKFLHERPFTCEGNFLVKDSIWNGKRAKIKFETLQTNKGNGDLGLIDWRAWQKALKTQ